MKDWPSFDQAMSLSRSYSEDRLEPRSWERLESLYDSYRRQPRKTARIPRVVHQIWLGGRMPQHVSQLVENLRRKLPRTWKHKLWTEAHIQDLVSFQNRAHFDAAENPGQKSDILRHEILYQFGGIYCDTDFIWHGGFEEVLDVELLVGLAYDARPIVLNSCIGAAAGSPAMATLLHFDRGVRGADPMEVIETTGPYHTTRKVFESLECGDTLVLPNSFLYPFPNFPEMRIYGPDPTTYVQPETMVCHLWDCSWIRGHYDASGPQTVR